MNIGPSLVSGLFILFVVFVICLCVGEITILIMKKFNSDAANDPEPLSISLTALTGFCTIATIFATLVFCTILGDLAINVSQGKESILRGL